jgi:DNA-binding MarR family transcriptional regulator
MLGLQLKLTPAQVRVLLELYWEEIDQLAWLQEAMSRDIDPHPWFLSTTRALERRNLVEHVHVPEINAGIPYRYRLTTEGKGVALLVYKAAKDITDQYERILEAQYKHEEIGVG